MWVRPSVSIIRLSLPVTLAGGQRRRGRRRGTRRRRRPWCPSRRSPGASARRPRPWPRGSARLQRLARARRARVHRDFRVGRARAGPAPLRPPRSRSTRGAAPARRGRRSAGRPRPAGRSRSAMRSVRPRATVASEPSRSSDDELGGDDAEADHRRDVLQPAPAGPLLRAADDELREPQAAPHEQRACALGPAHLVGGDRHEVGTERVEIDGDVARGHARVDVHEHAPLAAPRWRPRPRAGASRPRGWRAARSPARSSGRTAATTSSGSNRPSRSTPTAVTSPGTRRQASSTAECSTAVVTTWTPSSESRRRADRAPHRGVDRFGPARREHDFARPGPEQRGHLLAGFLEGDRVVRPSAWRRPGSAWCSRRNGSIASSAAGRSGEVEAWSR